MASYVVRVYRYTADPPALVGVVVGVEDQVQHSFRSQEEFWGILGKFERGLAKGRGSLPVPVTGSDGVDGSLSD